LIKGILALKPSIRQTFFRRPKHTEFIDRKPQFVLIKKDKFAKQSQLFFVAVFSSNLFCRNLSDEKRLARHSVCNSINSNLLFFA